MEMVHLWKWSFRNENFKNCLLFSSLNQKKGRPVNLLYCIRVVTPSERPAEIEDVHFWNKANMKSGDGRHILSSTSTIFFPFLSVWLESLEKKKLGFNATGLQYTPLMLFLTYYNQLGLYSISYSYLFLSADPKMHFPFYNLKFYNILHRANCPVNSLFNH